VFLIIESAPLVTKLAHVILSGQLPTQFSEVFLLHCFITPFILANQKPENASRVFQPPEVTLESKFRQPVAKGYIPAQRTTPTQKRNVT